MHIQSISPIDRIPEAWPLLELHREELATYKHLMILKPDMDKYRAIDAAGNLLGLGLFNEDKIVGYSIFIITNALHYADLKIAQNDILYIHPDYRGTQWGIRLIKASEDAIKERGIKMIMWHGKENTSFSSLMPRLGYLVQDIMFSKELQN
jgi:GNAT superfamily N-acetyltransferase